MRYTVHSLPTALALAALLGAIAVCGISLSAGASQVRYPSASSIVQPEAYVSLMPIPRGQNFEIAVVGKIMTGYHVNAHVPSEDYLIPTKVTAALPAGVTLVGTTYPPGMIHKFEFAPMGLRVYENSFTVLMHLRAGANVALGQQKIALTVAYQACNEEACLPPTKVQANADLAIGAANAPSHAVNPEVFAQPAANKSAASH